jgi:hypothetical protein
MNVPRFPTVMPMPFVLRLSLALLAATALHPAPARAATAHDTCTGFIDTVPATISTPGTWCLRKDLSLGLFASGAAIRIASNNVRLDCSQHRIHAFVQNNNTTADGIVAEDRLNVTVRNCRVSAFARGIALTGASGGGHVVEDNTSAAFGAGVYVEGDGSTVRRNEVGSIGLGKGIWYTLGYGIYASGDVDVLDNAVTSVQPWDGGNAGYGIYSRDNQGTIARNRLGQMHQGIVAVGTARTVIRDNQVALYGTAGDTGIACESPLARAEGNFVFDAAVPVSVCSTQGNTLVP